MALQGPFVVIADSPAPDIAEALRAAGAYPVIETGWADARSAMREIEPEAVVLADACADKPRVDTVMTALAAQRGRAGALYMPVIARIRDDAASPIPDVLAIAASAPRE